jgi:hypothetical protein
MRCIKIVTVFCLLGTFALINFSAAEDGEGAAAKVVNGKQDNTGVLQSEIVASKAAQDASLEIAVLKEQNKIISSYQDRILNTVYFALSSLIGAAFLLASFGWWTNSRKITDEIERLRAETNQKVAEHQSNMMLQLSESRREFETFTIGLGDKLDKKMNDGFLNFNEKISNIETISTERNNKYEEDIKGINKSLTINAKSISDTNYELRLAEENIWEIKNIPINVLVTQAQGLSHALETEDKKSISRVLERMEKFIGNNFEALSGDINSAKLDTLVRSIEGANKYDNVKASLVISLLYDLNKANSKSSE